MSLEDIRLPFTWKQIKSRAYRELSRKLKPIRVIYLYPALYFEIKIYLGDFGKYDDFLHFYYQTSRIKLPEVNVGDVFDDEVGEDDEDAEYYTGTSKNTPAKQWQKATEKWLHKITPLSEEDFRTLLERQRLEFSPRLEVLDTLGNFVEGYVLYDHDLDVELMVRFERAYCRLRYEWNN